MTAHDRPPGPEGDPIAEAIARVTELDAAATKGPWVAQRCRWAGEGEACGVSMSGAPDRFDGSVFTDAAGDECHHIVAGTDAALIAYYRTAAPLLAAECERLRERVAVLEEALWPFVENADDEVVFDMLVSAGLDVAVIEARAALKGSP